MSGYTVRRQANTTYDVTVQGMGHHPTVELVLWFAREAQKAVDEGMDPKTQVRIDGSKIRAVSTVTQEIP